MRARRQFPVGNNLFQEENATSILGDPLWIVNYNLEVPKPQAEIEPQSAEKSDNIYDDLKIPTFEPVQERQQLSKAQLLIQQSQALIQKRKLGQNMKVAEINTTVQAEYNTKLKQSTQIEDQQDQPQEYAMNLNQHESNQSAEIIQSPPTFDTPIANIQEPIYKNDKKEQTIEAKKEIIAYEVPQNLKHIPSKSEIYQSILHGVATLNPNFNIQKVQSEYLVQNYPGPLLQTQRRADQIRHLQHFWSQFQAKSPLMELAIQYFERDIFREERKVAIRFIESQILNNQAGQAFIKYYDDLQNNNSQENLLLRIILTSSIGITQQEMLIPYITTRQYQDYNESLVIHMLCLLKMEQSDMKDKLYHLINDNTVEFKSKLLWIALKQYPLPCQVEEFFFSFFTKLNYDLCTSEVQILLADTYACYKNQQVPVLYHRLSLLFLEQGNFSRALDCVKVAIDLGYSSKEVRERILQAIEIQDKKQNTTKSGGLLSYFKNESKPKQEPQESQFYYDKNQKAWVINGVVQQEEHDFGNKQPSQASTQLPPPQKQSIPPPRQTEIKQQAQIEQPQLLGETGGVVPADNPWEVTKNQGQGLETRQKKNQLLRNRYVQQQ